VVREAALTLLVGHGAPGSTELMFAALDEGQPDDVQLAGLSALNVFKGRDPRVVTTLRRILKSADEFEVVFQAIDCAANRKLKELVPDLQDVKSRLRFTGQAVDSAIKAIQG
jgi:hypothetical protein